MVLAVLTLSGGSSNCRTWVRRARDPGPGPADPKRRHDERSRPTAAGRPEWGAAGAVHSSRADTTPRGGSDVSTQVRALQGSFRAALLYARDRHAGPARHAD